MLRRDFLSIVEIGLSLLSPSFKSLRASQMVLATIEIFDSFVSFGETVVARSSLKKLFSYESSSLVIDVELSCFALVVAKS